MEIIGISGAAGSGKDTAHQVLARHFEEKGFTTKRISFASSLKDICALLYGWDRDRLEWDFDYKEGDTLDDGSPDPACEMLGQTRRQVMQHMGTEAFRKGIHEDHWIIKTKLDIQNGVFDGVDIGFIADCRFWNELNFVRDQDGVLLQIQRTDKETLTEQTQHASEREWRSWDDWDAIVENRVNPNLSEGTNLATFQNKLARIVDDAWTRRAFRRAS